MEVTKEIISNVVNYMRDNSLLIAELESYSEYAIAIAFQLYLYGFKYGVSNDISNLTTYGYGHLDANGYWEYPLIKEFMDKNLQSFKFLYNSNDIEKSISGLSYVKKIELFKILDKNNVLNIFKFYKKLYMLFKKLLNIQHVGYSIVNNGNYYVSSNMCGFEWYSKDQLISNPRHMLNKNDIKVLSNYFDDKYSRIVIYITNENKIITNKK